MCRRLCRIFNLSAISLIMFAVSKRISLSEDSDQMAPPSVDFLNPLPLCLFMRDFLIFLLFPVF